MGRQITTPVFLMNGLVLGGTIMKSPRGASPLLQEAVRALDIAGSICSRTAAAVAALMMAVGCSPYLYKAEINGFSAGVDTLGSAYSSGLRSTTAERQERQRWDWSKRQARLALTEDCVLQASAGRNGDSACSLREVGIAPPSRSKTEQEVAKAAPIIKALRDYASSLVAVTNAEDQQTLEAAQAQFSSSLQDLAKQTKPELAAQLGPVADAFAAATTAGLNSRRYKILKNGVIAANKAVADLGDAMGDVLNAIRTARANELRLTADFLTSELGPSFTSAEYMTRLTLIESKVDSLEALRRSGPRQAAKEMVKAHDDLARALMDDRRQVQGVGNSVRTFVDKAKAVQEAFRD